MCFYYDIYYDISVSKCHNKNSIKLPSVKNVQTITKISVKNVQRFHFVLKMCKQLQK